MWFCLYLNSISAHWKRGEGLKRKAAPIWAIHYPGRNPHPPWTPSSLVQLWVATFKTRCINSRTRTDDSSVCLASFFASICSSYHILRMQVGLFCIQIPFGSCSFLLICSPTHPWYKAPVVAAFFPGCSLYPRKQNLDVYIKVHDTSPRALWPKIKPSLAAWFEKEEWIKDGPSVFARIRMEVSVWAVWNQLFGTLLVCWKRERFIYTLTSHFPSIEPLLNQSSCSCGLM